VNRDHIVHAVVVLGIDDLNSCARRIHACRPIAQGKDRLWRRDDEEGKMRKGKHALTGPIMTPRTFGASGTPTAHIEPSVGPVCLSSAGVVREYRRARRGWQPVEGASRRGCPRRQTRRSGK
jgi:hypothetical protein